MTHHPPVFIFEGRRNPVRDLPATAKIRNLRASMRATHKCQDGIDNSSHPWSSAYSAEQQFAALQKE
jgi:hypothetical protein